MIESVGGTEWLQRARALKDEGWWLADLCGVDRLGLGGRPRFEIVCQFLHRERIEWMTVHVAAEGDPPTVSSVTELFPMVNFMEREAFDLLGIHFDGHPALERIMLPEGWEGHPLRKDYGVGKVAVEFVPQPYLQVDAPGQEPDPIDARSDVDRLGQSGPGRPDLGGAPGAYPSRGTEA